MNNFKIIYKILKHFEASLDYEEVDLAQITAEQLGISEVRWEQLLIMLYEEGYISGIAVSKSLSTDRKQICRPIRPNITLKGLEYLEENSVMKKAEKIIKGVSEML